MYDLFDLTLSDGKVMKGCKWLKRGNKKNVVIVTGMAESSYRYDEFALFLNSKGFNVYCISFAGFKIFNSCIVKSIGLYIAKRCMR